MKLEIEIDEGYIAELVSKVLYMRVYTRDGTPSQKLERGIV